MAGMTVGGLASGLDTNSIITGLISIEQQRVTVEENKKSDYEVKLTTFNDLKTKLSDFDTKAQDLDKTTALNVFKNTSSDSTVADISAGNSPNPGNYDVKVLQLASSLKVSSKAYNDSTTALGLTGSFTISTSAASLKADPTTTSVQIDVAATDALKDIAAKINRAKGTGATASILQMGTNDCRLMLSGVDEGTRAFSLTSLSGGIVDSTAGLDLMTTMKSARTDFDLRLATGGPAATTTTISALFNGIGSGIAITANDTITISGTKSDGTAAAGTFTIANPAVNTVQDLMTSIQTAYGGAAAANVTLNSSGEIVVTDKTGLTASNITLNLTFNDVDASGSRMPLGTSATRSDFKSVVSQGAKAFYLMNSMSVSSYTNKDDQLVAGTVFQLKRVDTLDTIKLTLDFDKDGIKKKVQDFLDSYNLLLKFLDDKSKVEISKPDAQTQAANPAQKTQIIKGPFAGDSSILGLKSQLQGLMTNTIPELTSQNLGKYSSLSAIGITSEQKTGFLTIDSDKFNASLDADFEGVKRLFATNGYCTNSAHTFGTYTKDTKTGVYDINPAGAQIDTDKDPAITTWAAATIGGAGDIMNSTTGDSNGLAVQAAVGSGVGKVTFVRGVAGQVKAFYDQITDFVNGFMTTTGKGIQDQIDAESAQITKLNAHVTVVKDRLTQQFANLELAISKLQSQSAAFGGQITSMKR